MKRVVDFLSHLSENNNREWFEEHKQDYLLAKDIFDSFTAELIVEIAKWDADINPDSLKVKDCTYRIYRDTRFSKNKLPYKTHMGAFICKGGKKAPYSGYYFHVEPKISNGDSFLGGNLLYTGLYRPEPKVIHSIRDEISVNGDNIIKAIKNAKGFEIVSFDKLKKVPKGYENIKSEWQELIKHKDFSLGKEVDNEYIFAPDLISRVSAEFKKTHEFSNILNMAVQYAIEEM